MGQILLAGEEPHHRAAPVGDLVADRPAQHRIAGLECVQDRTLRDRTLEGELTLDVERQATLGAAIDALEARYPVLRGTIREQVSHARRPFLRFYACREDLSHEPPDSPLPDAVATGAEPFLVVGAIAGG